MTDSVEGTENAERVIEIKVRSRFRVVLVHMLKSAVFLPLTVKYLLFAFLAIAKPPLGAAVLLWAVGSIAVYVFSIRRSLSSIRRKVTVVTPERCIFPSLIGLGVFALFNVFIDTAMSMNSGSDPGPLIVLSLIVNSCIFAYQCLATQRTFAAMADANARLPIKVSGILVAVGDVAIVAGILIIIVSAMNGAF